MAVINRQPPISEVSGISRLLDHTDFHDQNRQQPRHIDWAASIRKLRCCFLVLCGVYRLTFIYSRTGIEMHDSRKTKAQLMSEIVALRQRLDETETSFISAHAGNVLPDSGLHLSQIIEFLPDATIVVDNGGKVVFWNRAIEAMTGRPSDEMIGKGNYEYAVPFYRKRRPILIDQALHPELDLTDKYIKLHWAGPILKGEGPAKNYMGRDVHLSATASVLKDTKGNVVAAIECIRDVTEQKRAEYALWQSEEKYREIFDNTPIAVWEQDLSAVKKRFAELRVSGISDLRSFLDANPDEISRLASLVKVVSVNEASRRILGFESSKEPKPDLTYCFNYKSLPVFAEVLIALEEGRLRFDCEFPAVNAKGQEQLLELSLAVSKGHENTLSRVLVSFSDKTERKKAEDGLRESEQRFKNIFDSANDGVLVVDPDTKMIRMGNNAACEMLGYNAAEIGGLHLKDLVSDQDSHIPAWFKRHLKREIKLTEDVPLKRKDHAVVYADISSSLIDVGGKTYLCGFLKDITERKLAEESLREKENIFRLLFDQSGDGNLLIDDGFFIDCNESALNMLRSPDKQALLKVKPSAISPVRQPDGMLSSEKEQILIRQALREGPIHFEWMHRKLDGSELLVDVLLTPIRMGGKTIIYTAWRDITEKRILQQEVIHKEKLASLGMLVSSISHEINNPNNFIIFNIPILKEYLRELVPVIEEYMAAHPGAMLCKMPYREFNEDIFKLLDNMEHGANRINTTISNLLEFSRKKVREAREKVRIKDVLDKAVAICQSEIRRSAKKFQVDVEKSLPSLMINPEDLEQVFINLLINATQALDKKDSFIGVRLLKGPPRSGDIAIEVVDNGVGFDDQTKARLFEPFFTKKATGVGGTGIGLYIVKRIIDEAGGRIEVESEPGRGSLFRIVLPRARNFARRPDLSQRKQTRI